MASVTVEARRCAHLDPPYADTARAFLDPGGVCRCRREHGMAPAEGVGVHQLSLGVIGRSRKENERRLPLHPQHLSRIPDDLRD
jgi:hypothetical protein